MENKDLKQAKRIILSGIRKQESKEMDIKRFRFIIDIHKSSNIVRGTVINILHDVKDSWSNVIRALIIGNSSLIISKSYLIEKINFCIDNPLNPEGFLSTDNLNIWTALEYKFKK